MLRPSSCLKRAEARLKALRLWNRKAKPGGPPPPDSTGPYSTKAKALRTAVACNMVARHMASQPIRKALRFQMAVSCGVHGFLPTFSAGLQCTRQKPATCLRVTMVSGKCFRLQMT